MSARSAAVAAERRLFANQNALTAAAALITGVLGYVLQSITSHALHPVAFGKAFAVVTLFALLTRPAAAFGRLVAWQTSRDAGDDRGDSAPSDVLHSVTSTMLSVGAVMAVFCLALMPILDSFFGVPVKYIVVGAAGVPFLLAVQPLLGAFQGEQKFLRWSLLSVWVTLSRVVIVIPLVFVIGAYGVVVGTTASAAVNFVVGATAVNYRPRNHGSGDGQRRFDWRAAAPFIVTAIASTVTVGVFLGADVLIVEHFFDKVRGGQYAAVSIIGNAVFFATGGVVSVVFPKVAQRQHREQSTYGLMAASLGLCLAITIAGTVVLQLFGREILLLFSGHQYVAGHHYLGWYALGMGLLGCVVVLLNTQQSLNRMSLLWILVPATFIRPALLILFHHTLMTVVAVNDLSVGFLGLVMLAIYVATERNRLQTASRPA